ncbi:MAG: aminotransferase class V-fold PLP-dependent enzyme [Ruminococcus sp.]|nr:aminotransferase class V-fold PLP-dependent enzyme [Ruminococcus sp.]
MDKFYRKCGVNVGRGQHRLSARASSLMEETRELLLELFHCENKKVIFTPTATEALNLIITGLNMPSGACVYISPFEHNAVTRTLHHLQKASKFDIELLAVDKETLMFDVDKISKQFAERKPFCVIMSHASNVCGAIAPIFEIFTAANKYNAVTVADMCQTAGLIDTDLSSDDFDYAVFEGHKTLYGPMGIGGFIAGSDTRLPPLIYGGTGVESANQDMPDEIPTKYEAGSHNIQAIAGLNAALKWLKNIGIENVFAKEQSNKAKLLEILKRHDNITVIEPQNAVGVISCNFKNYSSDSIGQVLSDQNIAVRTGLHCAPYAHKFLGTFPAGTVRFSVGYFNTDYDFKMLERALEYIEENS